MTSHTDRGVTQLSAAEIEYVGGAGGIETAAAIGRFVGSVAVRGAAAGGAGIAAAAGVAAVALAVDYALDGKLDLID
ncbi:hypothetical protein C0V72_05725 [Porphyrobacter sp. TH134]|uniref:hypothetical protein n=1 Tax=Porphyrobacter sp. TH134 TaxID=2067450 RepID=UPI000C7D68D4|nr:hypothetical protein [Porphyrobacter sp. TH134]PLK24574.1 hypothetical protein C0V72_05725 [Porphyrobacter sp. TH134]